jgi:DNA polymerase III epsilon subunit family exonuclease
MSEEEKAILLKVFPQGVVAIDLETTGLSPLMDRIIELSAIKVTPSGIELFDELINPEIEIPENTIAIHKITNEMVQGKPTIQEVLPKYLPFADGLPIIAHNARFDLGFILFNMHQQDFKPTESRVFCSVKYTRAAIPDLKSYKLGNLCNELGIELVNHHRALDDAIACLRLFAKGLLNQQKSLDKTMKQQGFLFNLEDFTKKNLFEIPHHLDGLKEAIEKEQLAEIKYRGGSMKGQFRPIRPVSLLPMPQGSVLYAHCLISDLYKSFALKKISDFNIINEDELIRWAIAGKENES